MYYLSEPPYFLSAIGFLIALASGAAFSGTLKQIVQQWSSDRATNQQIKMQKKVMLLPFLGITLGVVLFLSSGLEIFGFTSTLAYTVAVPLSLLVGLLVWLQLGSMLSLIERKGFDSALDLDSWR